MRTVTYEEFLKLDPGWLYGEERIKACFDRFEGKVSALDILNLDNVSAEDRLWTVLREEFIPAPILHEFACACAEYTLTLIDNPDQRSIKAVEVKRAWLRGEATDKELDAARDAACSAAYSADRYADWAAREAARATARAARATARATARAAAWHASEAAWETASADSRNAASDATREAQVAYLIMVLEEEKGKQSLTKNF